MDMLGTLEVQADDKGSRQLIMEGLRLEDHLHDGLWDLRA